MAKNLKKSNAIIVGDLHLPVSKDGYLEFIRDTKKKYNCGSNIFIGDCYDFQAMSFHDKSPELPSPKDERLIAEKMIKRWYKLMPEAVIMTGNHDALNHRKAKSVGIEDIWLKSINDIFKTPKWDWKPRYHRHVTTHLGSKIIFAHGDCGKGGQHAAMKNAKEHFCSYVQGHLHSQAGIDWFANEGNIVFGMSVGCGMDWETLAMSYGRPFTQKPIVSCGVIADKVPIIEIMPFSKYT